MKVAGPAGGQGDSDKRTLEHRRSPRGPSFAASNDAGQISYCKRQGHRYSAPMIGSYPQKDRPEMYFAMPRALRYRTSP